MSVEKDIRWELLARMCPNCTGTLLVLSSSSLSCNLFTNVSFWIIITVSGFHLTDLDSMFVIVCATYLSETPEDFLYVTVCWPDGLKYI